MVVLANPLREQAKCHPGYGEWSNRSLKGHLDVATAVAFSPSGKQVASGSRDKTIKLWNAATGEVERTLEGHSDAVGARGVLAGR